MALVVFSRGGFFWTMNNYIKIHYDILDLNMPMEKKVILALVRQMTTNGQGFWAGYKAMSDLLKIPKSRCKHFAEQLAEEGLISISTEKIKRKTRIVLRETNTPK